MFKHILLPTDGSDLSWRAVTLGIELARTCKARVYALHVVPSYHAIAYMAEMLAATEITYVQDAIVGAGRYLAEVQRAAGEADVECASGYVFGEHPHEAIIETARVQHCDVIVMGSHGWRGLDRLLLGSETHKVILHSDVPVLVCH
jgi:nucleotide-binding universal stress UspA family protein